MTLRLLQLAKHFWPDTGGIETVTKGISDSLVDHGIQADVLAFAIVGRSYPILELPYEVFRAAPDFAIGNKIMSVDYMRRVRDLSARYDVGLVHMPNPVAAAAALASWKKPLLLLWHADTPQPVIRAALSGLDRALIRKARTVIAPTPVHAAESYLASHIVPKSVVASYPFDGRSIPPADHADEAAERIRTFVAGRRLILSVGRLVPYKGFDILLRAAADLPSDAAVVIVGTGGLWEQLSKQIVDSGLETRVMLAGELTGPVLSACYEMSSLVCMPSVTAAEMYGMVQVEAMAFGKPIVSTRIPRSGVPCINLDRISGLTVEPGDSAALADALVRLVKDDLLYARLSAGGRRLFETQHDISLSGLRISEIVRAALEVPAR